MPFQPSTDAFGYDLDNGYLTLDEKGRPTVLPRRDAHLCVPAFERHRFDWFPVESFHAVTRLVESSFAGDFASALALQEFAGACLFRCATSLGEAFVINPTDTPRATHALVDLIRGLFPPPVYTRRVWPHEAITTEGYDALRGATLNLVSAWDVHGPAYDHALFRRVLTGEPIVTNAYKPSTPFCGHLLVAARPLPKPVYPFHFPHRVLNTSAIGDEGLDAWKADVSRAIGSSGALLWAALGYDRLLEKRHYTLPLDVQKAAP